MIEIILSHRKLLGKHGQHIADVYVQVDSDVFTPEYVAQLKADKDDLLGWKKHRVKLLEKGIAIE